MKTKCLLCTAVTEPGQGFYDHLEDVHMMPIRRKRINELGYPREETHDECLERFKFNHEEYGTELCWCPDCVGGETLTTINKICKKHGQLYIKGEHK
jgi:hypothetical protein